jgi:hypothetical protein
LSEAPDRDPIFIASPLRRKALLPNISPARGCCTSHSGPSALKEAMRAKNELLRVQLKKARDNLLSPSASTCVQQIDESRMCRGRTF